jgi:hypothetical protein
VHSEPDTSSFRQAPPPLRAQSSHASLFNWRSASALKASSSAQSRAMAISATRPTKLSLETAAETLGLDKTVINAADLIVPALPFIHVKSMTFHEASHN